MSVENKVKINRKRKSNNYIVFIASIFSIILSIILLIVATEPDKSIKDRYGIILLAIILFISGINLTLLFAKLRLPRTSAKKPQRIIQLIIAIISSISMFVILETLGLLFAFIPDFTLPSSLSVIIISTFSLLFAVSGSWNKIKHNWYMETLSLVSISSLLLAGAIHSLRYFLLGWIWIIPLIGIFILVWLLPVLNKKLSDYLNYEPYKPKTLLGKYCLYIIITIIVIIFFLIVCYRWFFYGDIKNSPNMLKLGIIFTLLSIYSAQTFSNQLWKYRPWIKKDK
jgi:hypothetical protein